MKKNAASSYWLPGSLLAAALGSALLASPSLETSRRHVDAKDLDSGVVVAADGQTVYLMAPGGAVESLAASSGELRWRNGEVVKPLALDHRLLIAQAESTGPTGTFEVVLLDSADGSHRRSFSLDLPAGVRGSIDETVSTTFTARGVVAESEPYLLWDHSERYTKGIAPERSEGLEQRLAGAFRLNLASGEPQAVDRSALTLDARLPAAPQLWAETSEQSTHPAAAGRVLAATQIVDGQLVLQRWTAGGEPLEELVLFSGDYLLDLRTADGDHLIVVERAAPGQWLEYRWSVYSLETGQLLGQIDHHASQAWVHVDGQRLLEIEQAHGRRVGDSWVEKPRQLRSVSLGTGRTVWERPLRDPAFRGEFPR